MFSCLLNPTQGRIMKVIFKHRLNFFGILGSLLIVVALVSCCTNDLTEYVKAELRQQESLMVAIIPLIDGYIGEHHASPASFAALADSAKVELDTTGLRFIPGSKCPPYDPGDFSIYSEMVFGKVWEYCLLYSSHEKIEKQTTPWTILCYQINNPRKVKELSIEAIR